MEKGFQPVVIDDNKAFDEETAVATNPQTYQDEPVIDDNKAFDEETAVATNPQTNKDAYDYLIGGVLLLASISIITIVVLSVLIGVGTFDKDNDSCRTPAVFDDQTVKIGLSLNIDEGVFFQQLIEGANEQASTFNPKIEILKYVANGDINVQAAGIRNASAGDAKAIITVDGTNEGLCDAIENAPSVVSFDFDRACNINQLLTSQFDSSLATLVLDLAVAEYGSNILVGYINDLNFTPLSNRGEVWQDYKVRYNWTEVYYLPNAASYNTESKLASKIQEGILSNINETSQMKFIFGPWDYIATATTKAIYDLAFYNSTKLSTTIYGCDISDTDITVMTDPTYMNPGDQFTASPWTTTAGVSPRELGAALVRMAAKKAANELIYNLIYIPGNVVTQEVLITNNITNMNELTDTLTDFQLNDFVQSCWIDSV